ncbi:hypothetical protein B4N89_45755 [Embleya scabrispora]|uniref:ABC transporter domain-containing protein n=1 Tax=Embleya scabrispora TaxID=159449 RepID=A0A1T3NIY2_9ACTN|nr:hypothetical protein B4N89_45755 [Embleya scabrispora]
MSGTIMGARSRRRDGHTVRTVCTRTRAEHRIFTGLRNLAGDRAVVLVTHNLANTSVADRVVVLEKGRVVQNGTFHELVSRPGLMQDLWRLQQDRDAYRQREQP